MGFPSNRQRRLFRIVSARWQRRAIFLLGGIAVGAAAVALAQLADLAQVAFSALVSHVRYASLVLTPMGFALSVYLTNRFFQNAQGSGIPQAIAARHLTDQTARESLVSLRIAAGKILLTLFGLLCGASVGREGPTVQIGASIMFALGRFSPRRQPGLILAGAAAGVAAAFNTPLAGIVFGIEEMSRAFETRTSSLIIGAVIAAGLTSLALMGNYTYFGTSATALRNGADWLAVPLCGVAGGLAGGLFSRILIAMARGFANPVGRAIKRYPVGFAAICGFAAAICGVASDGAIYGTGYQQVKSALEAGSQLPASFSVWKFLATTFASISGMPGGIFAPSLAVGAGLGSNIAPLFHGAPLAAIMLLGMVSYFAGVVQAPITAFVIVTEMTDNHAMVVPLMAAALIAHASSRLICKEGVYHALAKGFIDRAAPAQATTPA
ncbi:MULTISPECIES: chloride channel protein [unclassified Bradyrhizobium]|uniref:chloride channel protein n=1 Tax=unclassified Bradyrhizobium TaxID=2631580 RepID=UPI001BAD836B|nr:MULTISPECIES: chloride channel protein [unclassified Bradyrhizobium]MBR1204503.1 chloride channel protein [Bradyrhizobium sp. AUGA SZCCT0124]MBR1309611.1 chloride channel protein [Bradyrhizobium sp. AUGA SZCCT0051]MBR1339752.1 chloride channel protein [Bradyrhizobium sp. AUGA SZCCT0105]MBR1354359.1 chloride channel protein [Bradyrhizobium sp. AUGA SZCCT0045]